MRCPVYNLKNSTVYTVPFPYQMSFLKKDDRVGELTIEERAVLWLHKHYPNLEVADIEAATKPPTTYIFPDYVLAHIKESWHQVDGHIYSKKADGVEQLEDNVQEEIERGRGAKAYKYY